MKNVELSLKFFSLVWWSQFINRPWPANTRHNKIKAVVWVSSIKNEKKIKQRRRGEGGHGPTSWSGSWALKGRLENDWQQNLQNKQLGNFWMGLLGVKLGWAEVTLSSWTRSKCSTIISNFFQIPTLITAICSQMVWLGLFLSTIFYPTTLTAVWSEREREMTCLSLVIRTHACRPASDWEGRSTDWATTPQQNKQYRNFGKGLLGVKLGRAKGVWAVERTVDAQGNFTKSRSFPE